jgi:hypothetical protein
MRTIQNFNGDHQVVGLSTSELTEILKGVEKGTFAFFEIHTIPSMNKTDNPFYNLVTKITKGNVLIGGKVEENEMSNYQKRVINKTGNVDFVPEKNNVGNHVEGSPVLYNQKLDRYYLQYEWFNQVTPKSTYEFQGNQIDKVIFQDFMRSYTPNKYGVNVQSVKLENIKEIRFNHVHYIVENEVEVDG